MSRKIVLEKKIESKSAQISDELKIFFREKGVFVVNLIGSPGAGKTSFLEALAPQLQGRAAVIEGDLQTDEDKIRIEKAGLPACEINTVGACHLDAKMIETALETFSLGTIEFLFIENVGNLVCPASFAIGEDVKVTILSVTEGDDKPAKYPVPIRVSSAMAITKMDLLPHLRCDVERMKRDALATNGDLAIFETSAATGEGLGAFLAWLEAQAAAKFGGI